MPVPIGRGDVQALVADGAEVLDVLDRQEFERSHLPGASNVPLADLTADRLSGWDRARSVIVYGAGITCDRGPRGARLLEQYGFESVFDYEAGKDDWLAYGLPFEGDGTVLALHALQACLCAWRGETAAQLRSRMRASSCAMAVVVDDADMVLGMVSHDAAEGAPDDAQALAICELDPVAVRPSESVADTARRLRDTGRPVALVTTSSGRLLGQVTRASLSAATASTNGFGPSHQRSLAGLAAAG